MSLSISSWKQAAVVAPCAVALAAVASAAPDDAVSIRHDPLSCVALDRYARLSASATPAERVAGAELQFRENAGTGWYGVRMVLDGDGWAALLPKPTPPIRRFEYRIVMTAVDLAAAETATFSVRVADEPAGCASGPQSSVAITAPIVIRVPAGAPVMPPVPSGFSPAGVVAAVEAAEKSRRTKWIVGAVAAGGGIAARVLGSGEEPQAFAVPEFTFFGTRPEPGAVLSLRSDLLLTVVPSAPPGVSITFTWRMEFRSIGADSDCVVAMSGSVANAPRSVRLELRGPLIRSNACRPPIDVATGQLTITVGGAIAHDRTLELPFTFID